MKTKNKILALVEIAVVLCSVFLVALPAIAAEQTTQEITASTSEVTASSEDDYVLDVYGNANEDGTVDMRDLTYVKLIFFGKKPETELADAKYDGKINPLDFIQIKLIIVGKEKELTFTSDSILGEAVTVVTVNKPVQRIVVIGYSFPEVLQALNAGDKVVGVCDYIKGNTILFPELSSLPVVGSWHRPDYEAILAQYPDVLMPLYSKYMDKEKLPGVTIIPLDMCTPSKIPENIIKLGYILDKREEAEEFNDWYNRYMDMIKSRTEGLPEDEKPKVMIEWIWDYSISGKDSHYNTICSIAGGRNIGADLPSTAVTVDPEWVMEQNPDIITKGVSPPLCGYDTDDLSGMKAKREEILNRPELANVNAVKHGKVYITDWISLEWASNNIICIAYHAKWYHPDLFEDLDPQAIHQEYLDRFQRINYDLGKHGVFVYPKEPVS